MPFVSTPRQHKLLVTWDGGAAAADNSQVQLFICFWQAAKFIIKTKAEARSVEIVELSKPTLVLFINSEAQSGQNNHLGETQPAVVFDIQAPVVLRNLASAIIHRCPKPKKHIRQADLFTLDAVVSVSQRVGRTARLFS